MGQGNRQFYRTKNTYCSQEQRIFLFRKKGLLFSSVCVTIVLFSTTRGVMMSNDLREECLECHMTSNDVREERYITVMAGRCVNKPDQTEPVGCYENLVISNFVKCV